MLGIFKAPNLDGGDYLESLSADILRTNDTKSKIRCELNIEIDQIGVKTVVRIALIITELITNSVKHAFANVQEPLVKIYMINEVDEIHLRYSDNGTWSDTSDESFGMLLIETFTEQLDGTYSRSTMSSGTYYDFCFKMQSEVEINEMN
ncbi:MAG: sensor histidine kinase [Crocinitomicaceae bacterium]|nr:sensor histidine kinase [Crocinitomicaceae bacterium]